MPLKLCLIGAGHMGRIHAQKLARMKGVTLSCIVDTDAAQAEDTARRHGVPAADHYGRALADGLQAAVIASSTETHYPLARDLLERGVHVFIEKPVAARPAEARKLIALARKHGLVLQVGHLERFSPPFRRARATIRDPLFLEAHRVGPFTGRSTDIDVIHDLMIHDIDLVSSLARGHIIHVRARGTPVFTERIDVAAARIEFTGGCVATLFASRVSATKERLFRVFEKDRFYSLNLAAGEMFSVKKDKQGKPVARTYRASRQDPVYDELRAFVRAIRQGSGALIDGEDGLRALILADRITREIERHRSRERAKLIE
jgi:predicted dehydrogenase